MRIRKGEGNKGGVRERGCEDLEEGSESSMVTLSYGNLSTGGSKAAPSLLHLRFHGERRRPRKISSRP